MILDIWLLKDSTVILLLTRLLDILLLFLFHRCRGSSEEANYIPWNQELIYRQQLKRIQTLSSFNPQLKSLPVTEYTVRLDSQSQMFF